MQNAFRALIRLLVSINCLSVLPFLLFFFAFHPLPAQKINNDIFERPDDSTKITLLYQQALELLSKDSTAVTTYAHYMLNLSEELRDGKGRTRAYFVLGRLSHEWNHHEEALKFFRQSLIEALSSGDGYEVMKNYYWMARCYRRVADYPNYEKYLSLLKKLALKFDNKVFLSYAYEGYGNLYRYIGEYSLSITNYNKAIDLSRELGNLQDVSVALNNMSLVYEYQNRLDEALKVRLQDYNMLRMMGDKEQLVLCLSNLTATYKIMGRYKEAYKHINEAMNIIEELGEENISFKAVASAYAQVAEMELIGKNYDKAFEYYDKEMNLRKNHKDVKGECESYGNLGYLYMTTGNKQQAEHYYTEQLILARKIGYVKGQMDAMESLQEIAVNNNDYEAAFSYSEQYGVLKDKIMNQESARLMAETETRMKVKEQQQKINLLAKDSQVQKLELDKGKFIMYVLILGILVVLLIAGMTFLAYRQKRKMNKELSMLVAEKTEVLNRRNKDLKDLIYRSSHELRAPIVTIQGLLNLMKMEKDNPQVTAECFSRISQVVNQQDLMLRDLMKVYDIINNKMEIENVNIERLFQDVLEKLKHSEYAYEINAINSAQEGLEIRSDRNMLAAVIENLASNAMKYRRNQREASFVKLEAMRHNKGVLIKVSDNGQGIPDSWKEKIFELFSRASGDVKGVGLGLYMVRNSVERLGGSIQVSSVSRQGSVFSIWLPDK